MTLSEVTGIAGDAGNFTVTVKEAPRYVDMEKCIACGACTEKCPKKVDSEYDAATGKRKAIFVKYAQAVPLKYQIDAENCIRLKKPGACGFCEKVCDAGAINFNDTEKIHSINVGAVILSPGFEAYDPKPAQVWGYGDFPNVITSLQLERYLSASGPTEGHLVRPSDGKPVNKVAFLQCVGSRDENLCNNGYCSSVCCMYAIKEAVIAKDHVPGLATSIFYMDMRTHGKEFDRYMDRAKNEVGVRFVRCKVNGVEPAGSTGDLRISYVNEQGRQLEEYYDLVVLSVGLQTSKETMALADIAGISLTADKFAATSDFAPVTTSREGIFTCGTFSGPKDIPQSVVEGSAAAAAVSEVLAPARHQLSTEATFPEELDVANEDPRLGVFVCHCGSNIAGVVDVAAVEEYAKSLPNVVYVERNLFSCSQDTQDMIVKRIREQKLNRIVIAACTPRTHEPLFRETLKAAGLNEYLVEMANIRNQNAWVHSDTPAMATAKAKDLVRMAAAKVTYGTSLKNISVPITQKGLVIGGGVAGMTAALNMAEQGFDVHLIERTDVLGGNALHLKHTWSGEHIPGRLGKLIDKVIWNERIVIHKQHEVVGVEGFVGNFRTTIRSREGQTATIEHGVTVVATGGSIYSPDEYGYRRLKKVVNSIEFDKLHELKEKHVSSANTFVFIQCVGSREEDAMYCSKVCCTHSVQTAIRLKKEDPKRNIFILFRDMRTYGQREALYRQARKMGIIFINYELHGKPTVTENGQVLDVEVWDHVLHRPLKIVADMVILASAIRPKDNAKDLAKMLKVPVDGDGFFIEAHAKLRPVDFSTDGMFVAGLAHYPKPMEESVAQALAASSRAATLLSKMAVSLDAIKAIVDEKNCDGCALCVDVCPYKAITLMDRGDESGGKIVAVNVAKCKGCGLCMGTCPKRGVYVAGFTMKQISSQIQAALAV
ncbi:heterodisulfide reductase subunit A [Desulfopila aestuarii DSM 18488]|uniref:Heterodisulfide reductase subunit A n=3 Tax=Desulfopila aestuarii TaxID=231440 RepID=A0A1M7Y4V5_9BACT|nr:heterodisulfide reductase subunit A [Desulfopila aestuarii DSM 18488]